MGTAPRLLLIDANEASRTVLAERLRLQGFMVVECSNDAEGAVLSLEDPPAAVVADLTMPSISGVQLCRLLGSEMGTSTVPVSTWIKSLAPPLRKRSSWLMSSFKTLIKFPVRVRSNHESSSFCTCA